MHSTLIDSICQHQIPTLHVSMLLKVLNHKTGLNKTSTKHSHYRSILYYTRNSCQTQYKYFHLQTTVVVRIRKIFAKSIITMIFQKHMRQLHNSADLINRKTYYSFRLKYIKNFMLVSDKFNQKNQKAYLETRPSIRLGKTASQFLICIAFYTMTLQPLRVRLIKINSSCSAT